jgi:hypothetical protein
MSGKLAFEVGAATTAPEAKFTKGATAPIANPRVRKAIVSDDKRGKLNMVNSS